MKTDFITNLTLFPIPGCGEEESLSSPSVREENPINSALLQNTPLPAHECGEEDDSLSSHPRGREPKNYRVIYFLKKKL